MLLPRFAYHRPSTVADAVALLARHGDEATAYAGGTELLLAMKQRVLRYGHLVDLKAIPGLADVWLGPGGDLRLGALATHHALERHPLVLERLPAYAALSRDVANVRVRVAGTLGGNLAFADPHADPPILLAALDATLALEGPGGARTLPAGEFVLGPYETRREPAEILTRVSVPAWTAGARVAYARLAHVERPMVGAAAVLSTSGDDGRIERARIWVGAVGPRPAAVPEVERALVGAAPEEALDALGAAARAAAGRVPVDADLGGSEDYKRHLVALFVERAVRRALEVG